MEREEEMSRYLYEIIETGEMIYADSGDEFGREYEMRHGEGAYPEGRIRLTNTETGYENIMYPITFVG